DLRTDLAHRLVYRALDLRAEVVDDRVDVDRSQAAPHANAHAAADARAQTTVVLLLLTLAPPAVGLGPRLARPAQRDRAAERLELDVRAAVRSEERRVGKEGRAGGQ